MKGYFPLSYGHQKSPLNDSSPLLENHRSGYVLVVSAEWLSMIRSRERRFSRHLARLLDYAFSPAATCKRPKALTQRAHLPALEGAARMHQHA